ncbi:hypothetical protein [Neisseria sp. CCUG12390]|uniref:hypothetical protein n=1 Tax=Neisseria sp. CCUG12390 TaxID=3392035 RepID=UPI003A101AFB
MIDDSFISYAAGILGDTDNGLSGGEIVRYCNEYAVRYDKKIPYSVYPFPKDKGKPKKATVLAENLRAFEPSQQFSIIKDLCAKPKFTDNSEVLDLSVTLSSRYSQLSEGDGAVNEIIQETKHWLDKYPNVLKHYQAALQKREHNIYSRNLLDDLRLSLEVLMKEIFGNEKALENQTKDLGQFLENNGISAAIRNLYSTVIGKYKDYQNNNVKHNDSSQAIEVAFLIELTTVLMRFLVQLDLQTASNRPNEKVDGDW